FDPFTNTWTEGAPMNWGRWYATATTLPDGRVLATSGDDANQQRVTVPEIYDPAANTWTLLTGASRSQGLYPLMFVLPDGRVYEAGSKAATALLNTSGSGSWTAGPTNSFGSSGYAESAAMYGPGKVLRAGGGDPAFANAAVIDMNAASPRWRDISPMSFPRRRHDLVILADGGVMAVGGTRQADDVNQAVLEGEIWNPVTEQWTVVAAMAEARMYHSSALLLADGRVVAAGGEGAGRLRAQIYSPPYLFKGPRPTLTSAPATASYASTFFVATPDAASIVSVALIRPSAVTHAFDHNQRYVPLSFTQASGGLSVTAPANANVAPPGYYMLFIKNSQGIPSVAKWVRVNTSGNLLPGTIGGQVLNSAGAGISGATVAYAGGSVAADSQGNYELAGVAAGEHLVTASAAGFAPVSQSLSVAPGGRTTHNFTLLEPGTIVGQVVASENNAPIEGVAITYAGGATATDANGNYTITGIASGNQTIRASAIGREAQERTVVVPANGTVTADFALQPEHGAIEGEVLDAVTSAPIVGATVSYSGRSTVTNNIGFYIFHDVQPGTYTVTASASNYLSSSFDVSVVDGFETTLDFSLQPSGGGGGETISFAPSADAYIKTSSPTKNYGSATTLRLRSGSPEYRSLLKFTVSGVSGGIERAVLRLYVTDYSPDGGSVYLVSNNYSTTGTPWTEKGVTWNNAPALPPGAQPSVGVATQGAWLEYDVTRYVTGNGTYSLMLTSASTNSVYFASRETANAPVLVVTTSGGGNPPPVCQD
ncbi:MAG: carboxypeptidase regulatory-like domain-containing protein, partial [Pseudomonadota bacterium]|nr:carboxypeptidase regulatory-like domain-containing protein [Pseudomonadota bacterium]